MFTQSAHQLIHWQSVSTKYANQLVIISNHFKSCPDKSDTRSDIFNLKKQKNKKKVARSTYRPRRCGPFRWKWIRRCCGPRTDKLRHPPAGSTGSCRPVPAKIPSSTDRPSSTGTPAADDLQTKRFFQNLTTEIMKNRPKQKWPSGTHWTTMER